MHQNAKSTVINQGDAKIISSAAIAGSATASASATPLLSVTFIAYTHDHFRRYQTNKYLRAFWMWTMLSKCTVRSGSRHLLQLYSSCATLPLSLRLRKHTTYSPQRPYKVRPYTSLFRSTTTISTPMSCRALEEESLPSYDAEEFYPVHLGDTIKSRYHVIGKLGYGANSTVWFCRDLQ